MHYTHLAKIVTGALWAAIFLAGGLPAAAHDRTAHEIRRAVSAPREQVRAYRMPRVEFRAYRTRRAPARFARISPASRQERMQAPIALHNHFVRTYPRERFARGTPRERFARGTPFAHGVRVARRNEAFRGRAPFVQVLRLPRRNSKQYVVATRRSAVRPIARVVYFRRRHPEIVYHPAYLTGRVVAFRGTTVVLQPLTGSRVVVRRFVPYGTRYRVNQFVMIPAMYNGGGSYAYACSPQFYPQVEQYYSNYYGTAAAYVNGCYVPQNNAYAYAPYTGSPYYGNASYYGNDGDADDGYGTPYDNCVWSNTGNGYCAAPPNYGFGPDAYGNGNPNGNGYPYGNAYPYGGYGTSGPYPPQQLQGLVVGKTGTLLMVLGGNGLKPTFVDESPALQNGYAVNGPVAVGQVVDAYGFYNGDMFEATALM